MGTKRILNNIEYNDKKTDITNKGGEINITRIEYPKTDLGNSNSLLPETSELLMRNAANIDVSVRGVIKISSDRNIFINFDKSFKLLGIELNDEDIIKFEIYKTSTKLLESGNLTYKSRLSVPIYFMLYIGETLNITEEKIDAERLEFTADVEPFAGDQD
jgi:hypothetical protein